MVFQLDREHNANQIILQQGYGDCTLLVTWSTEHRSIAVLAVEVSETETRDARLTTLVNALGLELHYHVTVSE